ncbi:unnamed protein product [Phyllotreta striolata]|uniref:Dihydrolipoamide acetyltransferase component of pyruvate dehydrogenase complex n=1 Tax=Phyllotreta striolata TaxID=444603 RepID=A0A9N9TV61_PHYSR|nr:unnamed protein product [Phyllotreta striolata]
MATARSLLSAFRGFNRTNRIHLYANRLSRVAFNLSDIGEGIREVVVKEWFVKAGDRVAQFDNICEVQSDKASVTITSRYDGVVAKLHYDVDETAFVGKPLVDIETENDGPETPETAQDEVADTRKPTPINTEKLAPDNSGVQCIPSVRRLAKEHNLDLSKVPASGKNGRILKEDVLNYMSKAAADPPSASETSTARPIRGFQKAMVKSMTEALKIPHFLYGDEILVNELTKIRKLLKAKHDRKISSLPFFVKAVSNALARYPVINSSIDDRAENIVYHKHHNIGIAVDTADGLAVPVIKNVQNLSIFEINQELQRYIRDGKSGKFSLGDLSGGTFTISNIGSIGGTHLKPFILPPQAAIMALGRSRVLPRFDENGEVAAAEVVTISVSGDHRTIDGATMARFCTDVKNQLENPYLLFLNV